MIDSIHVTEPKLNIDFRIDRLKKFNVIFGPNGSGKSLILWFEDEKALNGKADILYWMRRHFPYIKDYKVSYHRMTEDSDPRHIMYIKYIGFKK